MGSRGMEMGTVYEEIVDVLETDGKQIICNNNDRGSRMIDKRWM